MELMIILGNMPSIELSEDEWNRVVRTNLTGSWLVSKYVGARMRAAGGSIINISSVAGLNRSSYHGTVAYGSSKSGLDTMTKVIYNISYFSYELSLSSKNIYILVK